MTLISHTMCMAYGSLLTIFEHTLVVVVVAGVITIILIKIKNKKQQPPWLISHTVFMAYIWQSTYNTWTYCSSSRSNYNNFDDKC